LGLNADTKVIKHLEASELNPAAADNSDDDDDDDGDIEAQIKREVEGMKPANGANSAPFQIIKSDVQCGMERIPAPLIRYTVRNEAKKTSYNQNFDSLNSILHKDENNHGSSVISTPDMP
jgi:hypothetical protein